MSALAAATFPARQHPGRQVLAATRHVARRSVAAHPARRQSAVTATLTVDPEVVFEVATLAALPLYTLMALAPRWRLTQRLARSPLFTTVASAAYAALMVLWQPLPRLWAAFKAAVGTAGGLPDIAVVASVFGHRDLAALAWLHLIVLDLFQARWEADDLAEAALSLACQGCSAGREALTPSCGCPPAQVGLPGRAALGGASGALGRAVLYGRAAGAAVAPADQATAAWQRRRAREPRVVRAHSRA